MSKWKPFTIKPEHSHHWHTRWTCVLYRADRLGRECGIAHRSPDVCQAHCQRLNSALAGTGQEPR
jgi:hypothetical protein